MSDYQDLQRAPLFIESDLRRLIADVRRKERERCELACDPCPECAAAISALSDEATDGK